MMGKNRVIYSTLVLVFLALQGCAPIYVPSAHHTPLLSEKGELNGNVQAGTNGTDIQGAYAISDHVGVAAAASFGQIESERQDGTVNEDFHRHKYGELALTYFRPMGRIGRVEFLGGYGFGSASTVNNYVFFEQSDEIKTTGKYNKVFAQSNIGLETDIIETGLAIRLGQVTFTEFETESEVFRESEGGTFFEPAVFARVGWKNVKIEGQLGIATKLQDELPFRYEPMHFSLGINLNINTQ